MDNAGMSLFQGTEINLSNAKQNDEDEEDLEEQRQRKEELQNLLAAKLDDFNFDESTINSSANISVASTEELQNKYCDITNTHDQMKILYDVRLREINNLKKEFENYRTDRTQEINQLKNKMFVYEAEVQQLKISLRNSEELLVEKTNCISEMRKSLNKQDELIKEYKISIKNLHIDINTYQSTINELQLKLEAEKNPFHLGNKQFNSDEIRKAHQEQINKLELLLAEKSKTTSIMEKENISLQDQIRKCLDMKNEDNTIITVLNKNFESAQKQCHELIQIIEKLTNENHHLRDRVNEKYIESAFEDSHIQSNSATIEKLKKMLLDKSVLNETLETKLRDYENNLKELLVYRQLKSDVYKKEFQQCENKDHIKSLLIMQNDVQNYKRLIEDKNQQILSLDSTNKELLAKLEDMLSQTRNDIQNFSHKYNLPQLEKMTEDLKKSQEKIAQLEIELKESQEKRNSILLKLQKTNKSPQREVEMRVNELQQQSEKDRNNFENNIKKLNKELEVAANENSNLKAYIDQLVDENAKLKLKIKKFRLETEEDTEKNDKCNNTEESLKKEYLEAVQKFHEAENRIKSLEDNIQDLLNTKTLAEGEHCNLRYQVNDFKNKVDEQNEIMKDLEDEIMSLNASIKEKNDLINELRKNPSLRDYEELKMKCANSEQAIQSLEENNNQLVHQLENLKHEVDQSRDEILKLTKDLAIETEKNVKRNLEKELNDTQQHAMVKLQERKSEGTDIEILRIELRLREEIHNDYLKKLEEIEKKYKSSTVSKELYQEYANKLKIQDNKYREQLSIVLTECAQKINALEEDRQELLNKLKLTEDSFKNFQEHVAASEKAYRCAIKDYQIELQKHTAQWENWSKKYVNDCIEIETMYKKKQETIFNRISTFDKEVATVEKTYNDKIKKYVKNCKI